MFTQHNMIRVYRSLEESVSRRSAVLLGLMAAASLTLGVNGTANASSSNGIIAYPPSPIRCATPQGGATANGTIITTWECNGDYSQRWAYTSDGHLKNLKSGKCLTPSGGNSGTNGTVLTLWTCNDDVSQRFINNILEYTLSTQYGGKCITNYGGSIENGTYLTLWSCQDGIVSQKWSQF